MLKGFWHIFGFTFVQGIKQKVFIVSTVIVAVLLIGGICAVSVYNGMKNNEKSQKDIENIYFVNDTSLDIYSGYLPKNAICEDTDSLEKRELKITLDENESSFILNCEYSKDTEIDEDDAQNAAKAFETAIREAACKKEGLADSDINHVISNVTFSSYKMGETGKSDAEKLAEMIVPLIFCMVVFLMVVIYGSSVSKVIVTEKNSKLLETMLVSVSPYAVAFGKIAAVTCVALSQFAFWCLCAAAGFLTVRIINPDYVREVETLFKILTDGGKRINALSVTISVSVLCLGFFMYSVIAGMASSGVKKTEELSGAMTLFQIPVFAGYFAAYLIPFYGNDTASMIVRLFPLSSVYIVPADILLGNITVTMGILSVIFILLTILAGIFITGKIYMKKLF